MFSGIERYEIIKNLLPLQRFGCIFMLVEEHDAEFIFKLRTNPKLSRFIHKVSNNVNDQVRWIRDYKVRELKGDEFYFLSIDSESGRRQGLNRIYNFRDNSYELGSWLYSPDNDISKSILGDIAVKEIAFDFLRFEICTFEVRKGNKSVLRYHQSYLPEFAGEDEENYYFRLDKNNFNKHKYKYLNILGYGHS